MKRTRRPWLEEGLATILQRRVGSQLHAGGALLRFWRAEFSRGELFTGHELVSLTYQELLDRFKFWGNLEKSNFVGRFYAQSAEFCGFLAASDSQAFQSLLEAGCPRRVKRLEESFDRFFGESADELMASCLQRIRNTTVPAYQFPSNDLKQRIDSKLVAPMLSDTVAIDDRRLAIRSMGSLGYPYRADALIRILEGSNKPLRREALNALQNIAGDTLGVRPSDWTRWFVTLPQHVRVRDDRD